jgi:uncharacterized repeat protein (TIGR01451 family)
VTCTRSDALAATASYPAITITVLVSQSAAASLTNSATVGGGGEVNVGNDSVSDPGTVTSRADVGVAKTASQSTVLVGSPITYTVTASNAGPSDATGVQVTDLLPAGLSFVSANPSAGSYNSGTGIWDIGALPSGGSATLTVFATVTGTGTITNTASKTAEIETDPNPGNNTMSSAIVSQAAPGLPAPPNGGMAPGQSQPSPTPLLPAAGVATFVALLFLRRRSQRLAAVAGLLVCATLTTLVIPVRTTLPAKPTAHVVTTNTDLDLFGKPISRVKPQLGALPSLLRRAAGPITPARIRIPAIEVDAVVEAVGVTRGGLMDVPSNIWDAAWLQSGAKPGARGQAVIDGHLDSTTGPAIFADLHRLQPGDRIYVSDADGNELTFKVATVQLEPLDGFPTMRVFGPSSGHVLNLITCAGQFSAKRRTYDHRLLVVATLI